MLQWRPKGIRGLEKQGLKGGEPAVEKLEASVVSTVFRNPENGYSVLTVQAGRTEVTVVGVLPELGPGEQAVFTGDWMEHKTYDKEGFGIPVLTYEELAGLLLGYDPWKLGFQLHQVQSEPLFNKIGIVYNPDEKYQGISGRLIQRPNRPECLRQE